MIGVIGLDHRLKAESILFNALICPFRTFFSPAPSPSLPVPPLLRRSVILVEASARRSAGRSDIVSSLFSSVVLVVWLLPLASLRFPDLG